MSACGINIQGRSRKLYLNYRTTEEIRRLAVATLEGCEVDDLDDGSDEVKRYKSLSHGPAPKTLVFQHLEDALASLAPLLKESLPEGAHFSKTSTRPGFCSLRVRSSTSTTLPSRTQPSCRRQRPPRQRLPKALLELHILSTAT
jgi:hypothetical protein